MGYLGQYNKITSGGVSQFIQMGARLYIPTIGRFAQVDPVYGGTNNNYVYVNDPVNETDLSGACIGVRLFLQCAQRAQPFLNKGIQWGGKGARVISKSRVGTYFRNGNNYLRIGNGRISVGPAPAHYRAQNLALKMITPLHVHADPTKVWVDFNWIDKGVPLYRSSWFGR
jgi:RHS repeat-associated protein